MGQLPQKGCRRYVFLANSDFVAQSKVDGALQLARAQVAQKQGRNDAVLDAMRRPAHGGNTNGQPKTDANGKGGVQ